MTTQGDVANRVGGGGAVPTFHEASGGLTYSLSAVTSASNLLHPARVQADVARSGAAAFTKTALDGGRTMGLTTAEMLAVIASLSRSEFYKSMTTFSDHRVWQDVYHAATPVGKYAYIKISLRDAAPVIQFKER